ncbi:uncharacterized protein LOC116253729 [Nymphaea colorata]|uniref:uncharacterized protein LOC116253729 n=1 Tax=Nymphaea colorata TaxID=210225 RepID=UPI00129D452E|nr:uncharacterized protein LOC116253729 [Nymphaea colorata]
MGNANTSSSTISFEALTQNRHGDWVVRVNGHLIGFWPETNSDGEFGLANEVHWGGKVLDSRRWGRHTKTRMGSGHSSEQGIIKSMTLYDPDYQPYDPPHQLNVFMTNPGCYNVTYWQDESDGHYITVGGPGFTATNSCL